MAIKPFSERMGDVVRRILSCCDREDDEAERPALQISGPTNFRREDISIPGLDEQQQQFIRDKAVADARKMWAHLQPLQPLRSSPSSQFASADNPSPIRVSYEEFTIPRPAPQPGHRRTTSGQRLAENLRSHGRKLSASLKSPVGSSGYQPVSLLGPDGRELVREDSKHEMRGLTDSYGTQTPSAGKLSGESDSVGGSEFGRDVLMAGKL